jgi:uncharacterized protein (DUF2267 family)
VRAKKLRVAVTEAARFPINPMASGLQCHRRMRADREQILDEVMWRAGWADRNAAGTALDATLVALGERLTAPDAVMLAEALSPPLAEALHRLARHTAPEPSALYARIAVTEGVSAGVAIEHAQAVCRALANALDPDARALLAHRLPTEWAALFALGSDPEQPIEVPPSGTVPGHGNTPATGKPGSSHPLAEARARRDEP